MRYIVTNIEYDTDGEDIDLPESLVIDVDDDMDSDERLDYIADEISNRTGFCHFGFNVTPEIK